MPLVLANFLGGASGCASASLLPDVTVFAHVHREDGGARAELTYGAFAGWSGALSGGDAARAEEPGDAGLLTPHATTWALFDCGDPVLCEATRRAAEQTLDAWQVLP